MISDMMIYDYNYYHYHKYNYDNDMLQMLQLACYNAKILRYCTMKSGSVIVI
jgi:hypothetical protein